MRFAKLFTFADDCKLLGKIKSVNDSYLLQDDINTVERWCLENYMNLNLSKCSAISFFRIKKPVMYPYSISRIEKPVVYHIKGSGVTFEFNLTFNKHNNSTILNKAARQLGFIRRHCDNFNDMITLKTLYCSFVRSCLDYIFSFWSPHQLNLKYTYRNHTK